MPLAFCLVQLPHMYRVASLDLTGPVHFAFRGCLLPIAAALQVPFNTASAVAAAHQVPLSIVLYPLQYDYMSASLISISYLLRFRFSLSQSVFQS